MIDLNFHIESVDVVKFAAAPQLSFGLRVDAAEAFRQIPIQLVLLRAQIRIEPTRRAYPETTAPGLFDLFGEPERWGASMRSLLWTHANLPIPSFVGSTRVSLPIECTFDFNVAATKYFDALPDGAAPLCFLFSGTCFYESERGLQAAPISWEREAAFALPVSAWREMMDRYYPEGAWLRLKKETFDRLYKFRTSRGLPSWERALEALLPAKSEDAATVGD